MWFSIRSEPEQPTESRKWKWSSYGATARFRKSPLWLSVDSVLSQFGKRKYPAAKHYRRFVREGISKPSIWGEIQAQVLLGNEEFVKKLKGYVKSYEEIAEIPRSQRYLTRPQLKILFEGKLTKSKRDARIVRAVHRYGYTQKEVADFLDLHYSTVSRLANRLDTRNKT